MNLGDLIGNIHWLPVIVVTIFSFALGMLWHTPYLFGKLWQQENYPNGSPSTVNIPLTFGGTAILHLVAFAGLSAVVSDQGSLNGLLTGLLISIFWVIPAMGGTYLFATRSLPLLAIDAGFYVVLYSMAGLVLGVW